MFFTATCSAATRSPSRRQFIVLGWLGFVLFFVDLMFNWVPLEVTAPLLLKRFNLFKNSLFFLVWPCALLLQLQAQLGDWLFKTMKIIALLASLPWLLVAGSMLLLEDVNDRWETEKVLFRSKQDVKVRVEAQYLNDWPVPTLGERVVKLTPVLGLWQQIEFVDTARLDKAAWQRLPR